MFEIIEDKLEGESKHGEGELDDVEEKASDLKERAGDAIDGVKEKLENRENDQSESDTSSSVGR